MDGSSYRKYFRRGQPNIVGIKVAQLNFLLELQLKTFINDFQYNQLTPGWAKVTFGGTAPLKSAYDGIVTKGTCGSPDRDIYTSSALGI